MTIGSHVFYARRLVTLMDMKFSILGFKFGIDPLLDIIPGFGDVLGTLVSCYLFWIAYRLRVPGWVYIRMSWNVAVDYVLGLIPFISVVLDALYRSNLKNYKLIEKFIDPEVLEGELVG